ncbi:Cystathionine gamma-synthase [Raoultella terrigena]|uniref:Cystathionine gamma-synthase n=1 Tax=Raoultella terrigena TaxID=577 RepID=A0A4U9D3J6_RAOTE|nr:Cystathionine gamma-synthase [Raoultella terrigena]
MPKIRRLSPNWHGGANNIGVTGGAFDSYLLLRGLRTLSPRMEVAQRNAQAIVDYLKTQPLVKKLYHPSLPENQGHEIAARQQKVLVRC